MTGNRPAPPEQSPVFVDGSGRRLRRLRVAGVIVVVPAVGYVGLLVSTLAGRTHDPLAFPSVARPATCRNRSRPRPPTGAHQFVDQRPEPACGRWRGRRRGRNPATRGPGFDHGCSPPGGRRVTHVRPVTDGER